MIQRNNRNLISGLNIRFKDLVKIWFRKEGCVMFDTRFAVKMAGMASAAALGVLLAAGIPMEAQAAQKFTAQMESLTNESSKAPVAEVSIDDDVMIPEGAKLRFLEADLEDDAYVHIADAVKGIENSGHSFAVYDIFFEASDGSRLVKDVPADISIQMPEGGFIDATRDLTLYGVSQDGRVLDQGLLEVTETTEDDGSVRASSIGFHTECLSDAEAFVGNHDSGWVTIENSGEKEIVLKLAIDAPDGSPSAYSLYFDGERSESQASDGSVLALSGGQRCVIQGVPAGANVSVSYACVPETEQLQNENPTMRVSEVKGAFNNVTTFSGTELSDNNLTKYENAVTRDTMGVISDSGVGAGSPNGDSNQDQPVGPVTGPDGPLVSVPDGTTDDSNDTMLRPDDESNGGSGTNQPTYDSPVTLDPTDQDDKNTTSPTTEEDRKKDVAPKTGDSPIGLIGAAVALVGALGAGGTAFVFRKRKGE